VVLLLGGTGPAGLYFLLLMEQWEPLGPAYMGALVSLAFHGEGSRSYIKGDNGSLSSCVCQEVGLSTV
jgi:hypothetical protein